MWKSPHDRILPLLGGRPLIMGILNVTTDSFSDGGKYFEATAALRHAAEMVCEGADIIDIGAESTRPNAVEVPAEREAEILLERIALLRKEIDIPLSVDTYKPEVARAAIEAGADIINDVYAKRDANGEYAMAKTAAKLGAPLVATHDCRAMPCKSDFFEFLKGGLRSLISDSCAQGLELSQLILDPGVGFGKTVSQNFEIVRRLPELKSFGLPVLLGVSRKSFLRETVGRDVGALDCATALIGAFCSAHCCVDILRVHNVGASVAALKTLSEISK